MSGTVLIVDDEPRVLLASKMLLRSAGIKDVLTVEDSREVTALLNDKDITVVVLDLSMPHLSGDELLTVLKNDYPDVPVIIMTATSEIEKAVECMKKGAFDYLVKPVEEERFISSVRRAFEIYELRGEVNSLKNSLLSDSLENEQAFSNIITGSRKMRSVFQYVGAIAGSRQPVLITGETGVGKELIAKAIHEMSGVEKDFVAVNVAGLDDAMFSDTLFGHTKGAYTGAGEARKGLVSQASRGTLFLDEIGDLAESSQVKLLRLLQENSYYPVGSDVLKQSEARVLVATNHDIEGLMSRGRFRRDLYYRLNAHQVQVPALRERKEDIPLLVEYFLENAAESMGKKKPSYPHELLILLSTYDFPGNVRELKTMIYDAVARHKSGMLSLDSFREVIGQSKTSLEREMVDSSRGTEMFIGAFGRFPTLKEATEFMISEALNLAKGNQGIAATMLGISRQALNKRLKRK